MQLFQYKASLDDYLRFHKMVTLRMPNMSNEFSYGYLRNFLMSDGSDTLLGRKVVYDVERSRLISCLDLSRILYDVCHVFSDEPIDCMYMNTFYYYIGSSSHWESVLGILKSVAGVFIEGSNGNEIFVKAVARLPEIQRRRFLLYYEYDFNFYQIGEMEHCTASAVQKSVSVAREKVKAEMRKYLQP